MKSKIHRKKQISDKDEKRDIGSWYRIRRDRYTMHRDPVGAGWSTVIRVVGTVLKIKERMLLSKI